MKNLKLFVAPLIGAALLTACGPKPINVEDFKKKVEENYSLETIKKEYKGKTQYIKGGLLDESHKISDVIEDYGYPHFVFEDERSLSNDILCVNFINSIEEGKGEAKTSYFISNDTYTIQINFEEKGEKLFQKYIFNKYLVITRQEMKISGGSTSGEAVVVYTYE